MIVVPLSLIAVGRIRRWVSSAQRLRSVRARANPVKGTSPAADGHCAVGDP